MKIFKDVITGDEVLCDNDRPLTEENDIVYTREAKFVEVGGEDFGISANTDEEEGGGDLQDQKQKVLDVVNQFRLMETSFDKKAYMAYIKTYMKSIKEHLEKSNPDRIAAFQTGAAAFVKKVLGEFDEYVFYLGESMNTEGMVVLARYDESGTKPTFYWFKDGLKGEKV
eukprot:NODE_1889_length_733_cov_940.340643_g1588_i0.p1 GENE.NODE_1889_length_733_cov_940.340643_g1588_i0~~NODE_1889_length_733_cov_940.340643_g1588_i0.p1  ORF type:complete len:169 (-),score=63.29 NODE_1889_length_733_cov_940.340643_g1588_i0:163-669(-)